tara:strand:+ start:1002 stop:1472 length:471 start_codon:yes stop_codon:yes gene_type:complete
MIDKKSYKDINGTTRVGDALRWLVGAGKTVSPILLDLASKATGVDELGGLADAIRGDKAINKGDKDYILKQLDLDMIEAQEVTKRWQADMSSGDWLAKNIRPLVVANFTLLIDFVIISSIWGKSLGEAYLPLLMTMGVTAIGGYFTLREYGKSKHS